MKICIPLCSPEGLESRVEPHLPDAEHILIFDLTTRQFEQIHLSAQESASNKSIRMDAVLCGSLNRMTLQALTQQGIKIFAVEATTAAQAISQFENGALQAVDVGAGGCGGKGHAHGHESGGCCGGHGHDKDKGVCCGSHAHAHEAGEHGGHSGCGGEKHDESGGGCCAGKGHAHDGGESGCGGHGHDAKEHGCCGEEGSCEGHDHDEEGGCTHAREGMRSETVLKPASESFKIAVCSQNRKTVTEHAGKCRKFWVYDIQNGVVIGKNLLELPLEQSLHETNHGQHHPLDDVAIVIGASMGDGLKQKLVQRGIQGMLTTDSDPDQAVAALMTGWAA